MQNVRVQIAKGTLRELSEQQFVACTKEAINALADDHTTKIRELKLRFFT